MEEITFRKTSEESARYVSERLRQEDVVEVEALGLDKETAVIESWRSSDLCYTAYVGDTPFFVFGVVYKGVRGAGYVWALGTEECDRHPVSMVRYGRMFVDHFLSICPVLVNWCDYRYGKALKWLRVIGFRIGSPRPHGLKGELFCRISVKRRG